MTRLDSLQALGADATSNLVVASDIRILKKKWGDKMDDDVNPMPTILKVQLRMMVILNRFCPSPRRETSTKEEIGAEI